MNRPFVPYGDPILRRPAEPVTEITDEIRSIWDDMIDTMDAMPGVGLAAPQIGIGLRLAVVDASEERGQAVRMANPEILHASMTDNVGEEASPNLPGVSAKVKRPRAVTIRYMDENGVIARKEMVGLWARSMQHQIDHLDGMLYVDRLSRVKRDMLLRKVKKTT